MTTTAPRTLADQIRYCADQLTTATLLDRPNIVAATLRDLAEKVRETETPSANATVAALHVKQFLDALCIRRSTTGGADDHLIAVEVEPGGGPSRELVAGDLRRLLGERNELVLRADQAERERDRLRDQLVDRMDAHDTIAAATQFRTERDELRGRIEAARAEIRRQDVAANRSFRIPVMELISVDAYRAVSNALTAVETHLVDPEYRAAAAELAGSAPGGGGSVTNSAANATQRNQTSSGNTAA